MATIDVEIAGRRYPVSCRDGEEEHLRSLALIVNNRAQDAAAALGSLSEARQLLFTSLLLADDLNDRSGGTPAVAAQAAATPDPALADALERLAAQVEALAERLEKSASEPYIGV
jgi:cell division protein ZapA